MINRAFFYFTGARVQPPLLSARQRIADAGDHPIPLPFFGGGIIHQSAVHKLAKKVAAVVPDVAIVETRYHKEIVGHSPIDCGRGWQLEIVLKKSRR